MKIELDLTAGAQGASMDAGAGQGPGAASPADVRMFEAVFHQQGASSLLPQPVEHYAQSMGARYEAWRNDWMTLGSKIDLTDHRSAVHMLEQQARLSSQTVQFQFALQSADNVRHAFKSLTQQQA